MNELLTIIKTRIGETGPITIAEYMRLCLSHPEYGYYMRRDPFGTGGDFITAPEISQIFGELIGLWLAHQWEKLGKPEATLLELGPGRGTLMADALRATKKVTGFHEAVAVRLLEISPALKQKQWNTLAGKHHDIEWLESLDALPERPLLVIANEFFDALPIRQFQYIPSPQRGEGQGEGEWRERLIDVNDEQLTFITSAKAAIHAAPDSRFRGNDGDIIESCEPAREIITLLARHIATHQGIALIVDYGYAGGGKGDTLQAMRKHQYFEPLSKPGSADLTAHVDFAALADAATQAGARVFGPEAQGRFLMKIGAGQRVQKLVASASEEQSASLISGLERLASPDQMGELFKILAVASQGIAHAEGF